MTAVEWLLYHFDEIYHIKDKFLPSDWEFLEETSKAMEKKQINKACYDGYYKEDEKYTYEYYNETYNK